jgi:hypothetical protein
MCLLLQGVAAREILAGDLLLEIAARDALISALQTANTTSSNLIIGLFNTNQQLSRDLAAKQVRPGQTVL